LIVHQCGEFYHQLLRFFQGQIIHRSDILPYEAEDSPSRE
jgi:hypothetical protein